MMTRLRGYRRLPQGLGPLNEREFRLLYLARAFSLFGDGFVPVALPFAVFSIDRSPSALGFVLASRSLALVVFLLVAGVVEVAGLLDDAVGVHADHLDRHHGVGRLVADAARRKICSFPVPTRSGPVSVAISVGVAEAKAGRSTEEMYKSCDSALYLAKASGRNAVVHESEIAELRMRPRLAGSAMVETESPIAAAG